MLKKRLYFFLLLLTSTMLMIGCDGEAQEEKNKDNIPQCEANQIYVDGECIIPSPEQIDYAMTNALTFELTGYDLEYHYFVIQLIQIDGTGGRYELEYYKINDDAPYYEEGLYVNNQGYLLERDDHPNGLRPMWEFRSSGNGIYLYAVTHYETTDDGTQQVYDPFDPMTFEFVTD